MLVYSVMPGKNHACLQRYLEQGDCLLGQIRISGRYTLQHADDLENPTVQVFHDPYDAIEIARYDDHGKFRPLKTAPDLRHGWRLQLSSIEEVLLALDFLYPAAIGTIQSFAEASLKPVTLRETLGRQTGMYAVVKKITNEQAAGLIQETCHPTSGCLKKILWSIDPATPSPLTIPPEAIPTHGSTLPLLCAEACNLLVAAGRKVVKARDKHTGG